ncbi:MAG TPA: dienelactone hydrolase family protein [Bryobacteraceae bacterium]|nr:dienelactone hydrolase family protein [Bryobacteraceae bacterium]
MDIQTEWVNLSVSDGTKMRSYVATPATPPRAALLVFPEIFGINSHIRDITERFARQGYLAVAPELFHRSGPGFECGYSEAEIGQGIGHMQQVKPEGLEADIQATYAYARDASHGLPVGCVGFCMGGRVATVASIVAPLACGISFYGGGIGPGPFGPGMLDQLAKLQAPMLFLWGGKDAHIPLDSVDKVIAAMRAAGKPYTTVEFSEAEHGFFCDQRGSYNAAAAAVAWPMALAYLENKTAKAAGA